MRRRDDSKKRLIWAAIIGFIMISSVFGVIFYGFSSPEEKIKYRDFIFSRTNNGYTLEINKKPVTFIYFPEQVEDIEIEKAVVERIKSTNEIDVTYDENDTSASRIALLEYNWEPVLWDFFNIYLRKGFTANNSYNLPIINCSSAAAVPVLYFKTSNTTKVYFENSCIIAEAKTGNDFLRIADRIIYGLFGIIE